MKAIINNGITYKVTIIKGDFTYTEDNKGKIKCFQTSKIEVIEINEMPKLETLICSDCGKIIIKKTYNQIRCAECKK